MSWVEASPSLGRNLIPADAETGAEPVAVIRESLWRRRYSADPGIIGRQLTIGGQPRTVVGIMPDTFEFPSSPELWMPLEEATLGGGESEIGTAVRRLRRTSRGRDVRTGDHGSQRAVATDPVHEHSR